MPPPNIPRITPTQLAALLRTPTTPPSTSVIDVRDSDHAGGHIAGSTHVPSAQLEARVGALARALAGQRRVVFHCMFSRERGPRAAERFLAEARGGEGQEVLVLEGGFEAWRVR